MNSFLRAMDRANFAPLAWVPKSVLGLAKEVGRHVLRRPVAGLAVVALPNPEEIVLIRRGDTGTWALPGGTVEWGETYQSTLRREMREEAGIDETHFERAVGAFSREDRDPRFHAVTLVVVAKVGPIVRPPMNPLEIRDVRVFPLGALPSPLAMSMDDYVEAYRRGEFALE